MTINSALLTGVSALIANSSALSAISDNIANANTVGYKSDETNFEDLVTQQSVYTQHNSGGVVADIRQDVTQQGTLTQATAATDLGVNGRGFFVTTDKPTGLTAVDTRTFTRAGDFTPDAQGYLRNGAGQYLQGWPADATGAVTTDPSDLTKLQTLNVNASGGAPDPTTTAAIDANLNAAQAASPQLASYSAATNSLSSYDAATGAGVKPDYSLQVPVYDSKGGRHTLQVSFLKSATPNQWNAEVYAVPASDVTGAGPNGQIAGGVVAFTADGRFDPANTTLPTTLTLGASAGGTGPSWASGLGVAGQTVALNLATSPGGLTQYAQASATDSVTGDGGAVGQLTNVTVDTKGDVEANFDNGVSRRIGQVALATFPDADGLQSVSGTGFRTTLDSGAFTLKSPGEAGAGAISPSTLESSTVDLSAQFTGLIVTQRAYSASAKIITTADQFLQDLIDLKR